MGLLDKKISTRTFLKYTAIGVGLIYWSVCALAVIFFVVTGIVFLELISVTRTTPLPSQAFPLLYAALFSGSYSGLIRFFLAYNQILFGSFLIGVVLFIVHPALPHIITGYSKILERLRHRGPANV